mgnify:CR=1 FL=1
MFQPVSDNFQVNIQNVDTVAVAIVFGAFRIIFVIKGVNNYQFDFHFFGNDTFYVNARLLTCTDSLFVSASPARFGVSSTKAP